MKKLLIAGFAMSILAFTGCGSDDDGGEPTTPPTESTTLSGQITENRTLTANNIYTLDGRVTVTNGATLTIEAGTIIKAQGGTGANASTLIIARGAKIEANGTAASPIIFTSIADDIQVGQTEGTNLDENQRGLWGGLIILGNAPVSLNGDADAAQIEGIPASDTNGLYGGSNAADDSGSVRYVSIRHGGALIGEGNEINGLTLGGVGTGTTIEFIEVVGNVDDGVEFFGGTVNASNLLVWAQGDDAIDIDQAYSGTIDNVVVVQGAISDHGLEIDGPEGSATGSFTLQNVTLFGSDSGEVADYRSGATGTTSNVLVTGFTASADVELDNNGVSQNFLDGALTFANWEVVLPTGVAAAEDIFVEKVGCAMNCDDADDANDVPEDPIILMPTFTERAANFSTAVADAASATVGATTSAFSWTFANSKANLGF
ncbi:hypothetical protein [Aquimarina spongiae]|uniref:Uncharacterized protein n=1 Tax=Aquimarina spongiae TaxID=570521 RepID=A0A1M6IBH4_9FLAO|nr:hypothetical protein [Aquimarina spongiae]SHJ31839.1 hypothetical protein SAMN04488508_107241 [Aquimarina spongiae]